MLEPDKPNGDELPVRQDQELQTTPLALQYFQAVDAITEGEIPDTMGYIPVYLYSKDDTQP